MFGLLKKIFKKDADESSLAVPPPIAPTYARTATPSQPGRPASNPFSTSPAATGAVTSAPPMSATAAVRTPTAPAAGNLPDVLSLPLGMVVAGLSPEFQNLFVPNLPPNLEVQFALQGILPQLSSGRVRVAFGELRQTCPNGSCKAGPEHDTKLIELPLANILSRINPALLPRKTQRQLMDVPKDVTGLFGAIGEAVASPAPTAAALTVSAPAARQQPPAPAAKRRSTVPEDLENIPSPFSFPKSASHPPAMPAQEPVVPPAPPVATPKRRSAVPEDLENIPSPFSFPGAAAQAAPVEASVPFDPPPVAFQPEPDIAQEEMPKIKFDPGVGFGKAKPGAQPAAQSAPPARPLTSAAPAHLPPAKLQEVKDENYLTVLVSEVSGSWPESVLAEVQQLGLTDAQLFLPAGEIDLAMRKGKVVFKWKTIRSWMGNAAAADTTSPCDDQDLLLSLKVVAPKFLALRQPKGKQRKTHIEESIPDLFSGGPAPSPVPTPVPVAKSSAAPFAPEVEPAPVATSAVPVPAGAPQKAPARKPAAPISAANPNDLVAKTAQLSGVTGALLAMNDGLVVASQLPKPLQGETVAAFLPQIFGRLTQFASEMKLGDLSSVMLIMDNCPWIIFRTGKVYFAVVGNPGEALPLPQLTAIVADIKRQNL